MFRIQLCSSALKSFHFFNTHSHIHNFLVLVAGTSILHLFVSTHIYFISTATSIELRPTVTKVILIPVVQGKSYLLLLFSLLLLMIISKQYSTYTLFTAFVSKTVFYLTNSSLNQIQVKNTQKRRRRTSEDEEDKETLAFIQKDRLLFWRGHSTQYANLDSGVGHTVQYSVWQPNDEPAWYGQS